MRKLLGGAVALGVAAAGSFAVAGPGATQEDPGPTVLDAVVTAGESAVTVSPTENCTLEEGQGGELVWAVYEAGGYNWETGGDEPALADAATLGDDGSWSVGFDNDDIGAGDQTGYWPDAGAAADYEVYGPQPFTVADVSYEWFGLCAPDASLLQAEITSHPIDPTFPDFDLYLAEPSDEVTVAPVDPCPVRGDDELYWELIFVGEEGDTWESVEDGVMPTSEDGRWDLAFTLPVNEGFYGVVLACADAVEFTAEYEPLVIAVGVSGEEPPPKPERPGTPRPAKPIADDPPYTG